MATAFIPQTDPYSIPSGLQQTQLSSGGTAFIDAQGNIYIRGANGFTLNTNPNVKAASAAVPMTTPQPSGSFSYVPPPSSPVASTNTSTPPPTAASVPPSAVGSAVSNATTVTGTDGKTYAQFTYGGQQYTVAQTPGKSFTQTISDFLSSPTKFSSNGGVYTAAGSAGPNITGNLAPGSTGTDVKSLQDWLVSQGYMTQAQVDTGYGTYGPQTTAAVAAWQKANNIDTQGNAGYFGPISRNFLTSQSGGTTIGGTAGSGSGTGDTSTGNPSLDSILGSLKSLLAQNVAVIPPGLQITPALTQQFLSWAHQVVDPQTQQLIGSEIKNINASSQNLATQYGNNVANTEQQFGTNLATEQNQAGASGTTFSGLRNLSENNLAASTNRTLSSLASDASYNIGQGLRTGAANVGSTNAGGLNAPSLTAGTVSQFGGSRGSVGSGNTLDFAYDPSLYTAGVIPSNQNTAVNNLAGNYLSQYGTLAGANSGRSMSDLIGGITGLPNGFQVPSNLS